MFDLVGGAGYDTQAEDMEVEGACAAAWPVCVLEGGSTELLKCAGLAGPGCQGLPWAPFTKLL